MSKLPIKLLLPALLGIASTTLAANPSPDLSPDDLQFFENRVRPVLAEHCYKCHAADSKKIKGGLLLDRKAGWMSGGDSGEAIVPGDPDASMLIKMVEHDPDFDQMPPKSKLAPEQIKDLREWVKRGAPDPRTEELGEVAVEEEFDLEERKGWWSLQPLKAAKPPTVKNETWPLTSYDSFILKHLEQRNWTPAPPAKKEHLLRRASLALTGLAPTEEELAAFLSDNSPNAYEKNVDRLLASPHFGERWARHWMDSARFAESKAFEQDYTIPKLARYRDYLIRAFNEDLPYDRFIREQLAGDLLEPRTSPQSGLNEALAGPGFIYLTDGQHGPPDIHGDEARKFDTIIAATGVTFQGLTLACAKCHDHKFDAITAKDYYSFYGMLRSSRLHYANIVDPDVINAQSANLKAAKRALLNATFSETEERAQHLSESLLTLQKIRALPDYPAWRDALRAPLQKGENREDRAAAFKKSAFDDIVRLTENSKDQRTLLTRWLTWSADNEQHPELAGLHKILNGKPLQELKKEALKSSSADSGHSFGLTESSRGQWIASGTGFEAATNDGFIPSLTNKQFIRTAVGTGATTGTLSGRIDGTLRSPDFILDGKPVELWAKGQQASIKLIIRNYEMVGHGPTTSPLLKKINSDQWTRVRFPTTLWSGQSAYLEIQHHGPCVAVQSPGAYPPAPSDTAYAAVAVGELPKWGSVWIDPNAETPPSNESITNTILELTKKARTNTLNPAEKEVLGALVSSGLLQLNPAGPLQDPLARFTELSQKFPTPVYARSIVDGQEYDQAVYLRGDHRRLSDEPNPKHFLDGFGGREFTNPGSGRLEWANHVANPRNPLTSRVRVNRIWARLFGQGLVDSVDDFGKMGSLPSHPELLDHIARDFIDHNWSTKHVIRTMVLSRTFQMAALPSPEAIADDPKNIFLQHMPVQRMDAESIRDHILACSGELKRDIHGNSVPIYVEDQPNSRAKPRYQAPLDGAGRRSLYLELRRNYMPAFLRIFDMPNAAESTGKRNTTNVPAQALALLNDPFVHQQSRAWAKRIITRSSSPEERIRILHRQAFGREASPADLSWGLKALEQFSDSGSEEDIWTNLCHLMINRKEFIYVQ